MIRLPKSDSLSITVKLKTGETFNNKDITNTPFGDNERLISFWHEDKVRVYPIEDIEYCELSEDSE